MESSRKDGRMGVCVFFFKQKTAYEIWSSEWSSDVCSSDLEREREREMQGRNVL